MFPKDIQKIIYDYNAISIYKVKLRYYNLIRSFKNKQNTGHEHIEKEINAIFLYLYENKIEVNSTSFLNTFYYSDEIYKIIFKYFTRDLKL